MHSRSRVRLALSALVLGSLVGFSSADDAPESTGQPGVVRIGMIGSLFRDIPEHMLQTVMQPFSTLMQSQTGVAGQLVPTRDADLLGNHLAEDKVQLGVFHGFEFAWARQKYPELRPLMIAVNQHAHHRAHLMVRNDNPVVVLNDLKDKPLALARGTKEHCHLFLNRRCQFLGREPKLFFSKIASSPNAEEALDDVVDGLVMVTVVDDVVLDCYKRRKPGRFAKLKTLQQSELFPAAVIAYRPGCIDEPTLQRFRDGMVNANQTAMGKQLLMLWKLTGFEPVPADYDRVLSEIIKAYPSPTGK